MPRLGGTLLGWGGLNQAFHVHSRGRGRDVMGEAVGMVRALKAGSEWLIGDFSAAVSLIWGGRASNVYSGGHSSGCVGGCLSLCVSVCMYVGGEVREKRRGLKPMRG